jgi:phosphatidyl-myo-inositol dimannoside synthase
VTARRRMAIVRPHAPNLAEMAVYAPLQEAFDLTFFYSGPSVEECRRDLAAFGLGEMAVRRYRSYADWVRFQPLRRVLDYKLGIGSGMLTDLDEVLDHEIVNVVDPIYRFTSQIAARLRPSQRLIVVRWELIPNRYDDSLAARRHAHFVMARADRIVCASEAAHRSLLAFPDELGARARVQVIYPGIRLPAVVPPLHSAAPRRILTVARLQWQKGIDDLIAAVAILRRRHVDAELQIIGSGSRAEWEQLIAGHGLDGAVQLLGAIPHAEVIEHIASAAVYCQPSAASRTWCEQFGFATVEAMSLGRPIVAASSGALPEIVGPDGVFASVRNAASLADALAGVMADPVDAAARGARLAAFARARYDSVQQGRALCEFLKDV